MHLNKRNNHNHNHHHHNTEVNQVMGGHHDYDHIRSFAPLSTPMSSSTPGPPPFNIASTPLFVRKSPYYAIHPDTLNSMNNPSMDRFDEEGQTDQYTIYNTFAPDYTHTTIATRGQSPHQQQQQQQQPIHRESPSLIRPSPSPLQPPQAQTEGMSVYDMTTLHAPSTTISTSDWITKLSEWMTNTGFSSVSAILIVAGAVILFQYSIYHQFRDNYTEIIDRSNYPPNPAQIITIEDMNDRLASERAEYERQIAELKDLIPEQVNDTVIEKMTELEIKIDELTNSLQQQVNDNKHHITSNSENIGIVQEETKTYQQRMDEIETETQEQSNWFRIRNSINFILDIYKKPKTIPYGVNQEELKKLKESGFWETVQRGFNRWDEQIKAGNEGIQQIANRNIAGDDTPLSLNPHDCLEFDINDHWIEFELSEPIQPTHFEYIHIDKARINDLDKYKSPKKFEIFGKLREDEDWTKIQVKEGQNQIMNVEDSSIRLELEMTDSKMHFIRVEYEVNEEATTTRLYRFRIEGNVN